jgi:hypothetical protein
VVKWQKKVKQQDLEQQFQESAWFNKPREAYLSKKLASPIRLF